MYIYYISLIQYMLFFVITCSPKYDCFWLFIMFGSCFKRTMKSNKEILYSIVDIMGRPKKYFSEEEKKKAITRSKTKYMVNKQWLCPICGYRDYSLAGKSSHLRTKKHMRNTEAIKN